MVRSKKLWAPIAAGGIIAMALAGVAIAAESTGMPNGTVAAEARAAMAGVSLPGAASQIAALVRDAVAGGSNPSAVAAGRSDPADPAQAKDGARAAISAAQRLNAAGTAGTVGVLPGWGCGDMNHTHSGPPGRPEADPPPGCDR